MLFNTRVLIMNFWGRRLKDYGTNGALFPLGVQSSLRHISSPVPFRAPA